MARRNKGRLVTAVTLDEDGVPVLKLPQILVHEYLAMQVIKAEADFRRLAFMKRLWWFFNDEKFEGKMEEPRITLSKTNAARMRTRGFWAAGPRQLNINVNLFNSKIHFFSEIFLHEMCPQAVSEIDRVRENINKGHGPHWTAWMVKVGLDARRFDPTPNSTYMSAQQRVEKQKKIVERTKESWEVYDTKTLLTKDPVRGKIDLNARQFLTYISQNKGILHGLLVCPVPGTDKAVFLPASTLMTDKYLEIRDLSGFFKLDDAGLTEIKKFSLKFWNLKASRLLSKMFPTAGPANVTSYEEVVPFMTLYGTH